MGDQGPGQQRGLTFQTFKQLSPDGSSTPGIRGRTEKRYEFIDGKWVQLTAAGLPRKKPGRKPGTTVKGKTEDSDTPKPRKPRKPRDPNAPTVVRKRKLASASDMDADSDASRTISGPRHPNVSPPSQQHSYYESSPQMPKREGFPGSMQSILNADPPSASPPSSAAVPVRSSGLSYDPIRGNYDPVRETITTRVSNSFPNTSASSPRGPAPASNRSPSIASLLEPPVRSITSPSHAKAHDPAPARVRGADAPSAPRSPSVRPAATAIASHQGAAASLKKEEAAAPAPRPVVNQANFTTISNGPIRRTSPKLKPTTGVSTPRTDTMEDAQESNILDFGKARPGEELQAPTIVLNIPIKAGETNKYVNFMRLAEERYGWDALHPRLAANRDRKARIAAATASLEKAEIARESGDEMSLDLSDGDASNPENGAASGTDAPLKPKKKRNFKEDQYDVADDFVDDSELLWEAQAAASRDGFFVYSGPLVPEVEKPSAYVQPPPPFMAWTSTLTMNAVLLRDPNVGEVVGAAEEAAGVRRGELPRRRRRQQAQELAVEAGLALAAAASRASRASPRQSGCNANERRRNGRTWPRYPRRLLTAMSCRLQRRPFPPPSWVPRHGQALDAFSVEPNNYVVMMSFLGLRIEFFSKTWTSYVPREFMTASQAKVTLTLTVVLFLSLFLSPLINPILCGFY